MQAWLNTPPLLARPGKPHSTPRVLPPPPPMQRWEQHNLAEEAAARQAIRQQRTAAAGGRGGGGGGSSSREVVAAAGALRSWGGVSRRARAALLKANPHTVLALETLVGGRGCSMCAVTCE